MATDDITDSSTKKCNNRIMDYLKDRYTLPHLLICALLGGIIGYLLLSR